MEKTVLDYLYSMRKVKKETIYLLGIIIFATVIRVVWLNRFPTELFGDELDVGYQAYSLGHTLRDYTGQFLPTYIHSFSEWRAPFLMYASIPFVLLFGLNEWGVRLGPAVFGVASIVLTYILTKRLTNNSKLALLTAFLMAIMPWHIHYSRAAFEVTLLESLLLAGLIGFVTGLAKPRWFVLSAIAFGLMLYTYSIATVFVPLFGLALIVTYHKQLMAIDKRRYVLPIAIFIFICFPITFQAISGKAAERFSLISIFSKPEVATNAIEIERNTPLFPADLPFGYVKNITDKLVNNKPVYYFNQFTKNYLESFSPQFLFLTGDPNPRESAGGIGELPLFFIFLLPFGLYYLFLRHSQTLKIILSILLIAPIPAALTVNGGTQATRLFLLTVPLAMFAGAGAYYLSSLAKHRLTFKILVVVIGVFGLFNLIQFKHRYLFHNAATGYKSWQYGYNDSISYMKAVQSNYDSLLFTNRGDPTLLRSLFWLDINPSVFQKEFSGDQPKPDVLPGFDGFRAGDMYYVALNDVGKKLGVEKLITKRMLYLISQEYEVGGDWDWRKDPPAGIVVLHTTLDPYQKPLFYVVTHR